MKVLSSEGASVTAVENGFEAISRVKESTDYDLILMNLVMPMMSGVTAVREIKKLLDGVGKRAKQRQNSLFSQRKLQKKPVFSIDKTGGVCYNFIIHRVSAVKR